MIDCIDDFTVCFIAWLIVLIVRFLLLMYDCWLLLIWICSYAVCAEFLFVACIVIVLFLLFCCSRVSLFDCLLFVSILVRVVWFVWVLVCSVCVLVGWRFDLFNIVDWFCIWLLVTLLCYNSVVPILLRLLLDEVWWLVVMIWCILVRIVAFFYVLIACVTLLDLRVFKFGCLLFTLLVFFGFICCVGDILVGLELVWLCLAIVWVWFDFFVFMFVWLCLICLVLGLVLERVFDVLICLLVIVLL